MISHFIYILFIIYVFFKDLKLLNRGLFYTGLVSFDKNHVLFVINILISISLFWLIYFDLFKVNIFISSTKSAGRKKLQFVLLLVLRNILNNLGCPEWDKVARVKVKVENKSSFAYSGNYTYCTNVCACRLYLSTRITYIFMTRAFKVKYVFL